MPVPTQISDGHRIASMDHLSNTFAIIDHEHRMIHEGNTYRVETSGNIGSSNSLDISFKTPTGKQLHLEYTSRTENEATFYFLEGTEVSGGDSLTARNANRNKADASETVNLVENATITTTNAITLMGHDIVSAFSASDNFSARHEWVLKENTVYTIGLLNTSGTDNEMGLRLDWYETAPETD